MKINQKIEAAVLREAAAASPNESCGLLLKKNGRYRFLPCINRAADPMQTFEIAAADFQAAEQQGSEVVAVVHSHPQGEPFLSGADRQMQLALGLPWLLAAGGRVMRFLPVPHLRGRVFRYGRSDCYTLVRDAYHLCGIDLADIARGSDMDADARDNLFVKNAETVGFYRVEQAQPGDVVLTALGGPANHALLYLGNGQMLHHAYGQLSRREPYGGYWQEHTHSIWRHRLWQPEMLAAVENDLQHAVGFQAA